MQKSQKGIPLMSQSIPTGYIPPGNLRELAQKTCPGVGIWLLKVARGVGIRQGPGFCGKCKWNFQKIACSVDQIFKGENKKQAEFFNLFRGVRVFSMEFFLVYGSIFWFCYHTYLTKNLRSCPWLVYIWSFHWVMVIHTYFCTKVMIMLKVLSRIGFISDRQGGPKNC